MRKLCRTDNFVMEMESRWNDSDQEPIVKDKGKANRTALSQQMATWLS